MIECNLKEPFELDGETYDLSRLPVLCSVWTPVLWQTKKLYRASDDRFVATCKSPVLHRGDNGHAITINRLGAIDTAIRLGASDEILRDLGVILQPGPEEPRPLEREHPETVLIAAKHPLPSLYECLYYNHDGSYIRSRLLSLSPLPFYQDFNRSLSQRDAIRYVIRRKHAEGALRILGVSA